MYISSKLEEYLNLPAFTMPEQISRSPSTSSPASSFADTPPPLRRSASSSCSWASSGLLSPATPGTGEDGNYKLPMGIVKQESFTDSLPYEHDYEHHPHGIAPSLLSLEQQPGRLAYSSSLPLTIPKRTDNDGEYETQPQLKNIGNSYSFDRSSSPVSYSDIDHYNQPFGSNLALGGTRYLQERDHNMGPNIPQIPFSSSPTSNNIYQPIDCCKPFAYHFPLSPETPSSRAPPTLLSQNQYTSSYETSTTSQHDAATLASRIALQCVMSSNAPSNSHLESSPENYYPSPRTPSRRYSGGNSCGTRGPRSSASAPIQRRLIRGRTATLRGELKDEKDENGRDLIVSSKFAVHCCPLQSCLRRFKRQEHLRRHSLTHTGERRFFCTAPKCGKKFSRSDNLTQHLKTHETGARNGIAGFKREQCHDSKP